MKRILGAREKAEGKPSKMIRHYNKEGLVIQEGSSFSSLPRNCGMVWFGDSSQNHHISAG